MEPHEASALTGLPELTGVRPLWFDDWYDGPVSGLATHQGRERWYIAIGDDLAGPDFVERRYVLHDIPPDRVAAEWAEHRAAARLGLPGCLHRPPCPAGPPDPAALSRWWEGHPATDYRNAPALGWFRADDEAPATS